MITYLLPLITTATVVIRNAVADGTRPIALNGEVIGYVEKVVLAEAIYLFGRRVETEKYEWVFHYTGADGAETWGNGTTLPEVKAKLNHRLGLV